MKKVMFFSKNLEIGGMEKALVNLLNSLVNYYDITLILEEKKGPFLKELSKKVKIQEYKLSYNKNIFIRKSINFIKRFIFSLKNKNKYDFSCNYATYSYLGSRLAQCSSKNSCLYVHNNYYDLYNQNIKEINNFFKNHYLNKFKRVIFVSNESRDNLLKIYPSYQDKFIVINNLIDYKKVQKESLAKTDVVFSKNYINLLFVGRLDNVSKNLELLIKSVNKVNDNYILYILGDGEYKKELITQIDNYHLNKKVIVLGKKDNPYPYMKMSDVIILTSKYEGFPVIYLEALVLNKKVITTIPVSDDVLDVKKLFTIVNSKDTDIAKEIKKVKKGNINYNIDLSKYNEWQLNKIKFLIEGGDIEK